MDGALSSSRYGPPDRQSRQHHHRHDRRRGQGYRRDNRRHHPYRRDDRRRRPPGNRYGGASTTSVDPQTAMMRQLGTLLAKVGELQAPPEGSTVVESITKNIADLSRVLTSRDNASKFLKFTPDTESGSDPQAVKAEEEAGPLAHLVISTVSTLPLQTPSYAALTLAVNELAPKPDYAGFASRCVTYAMRQFSSDMDSLLLGGLSVDERSRSMSRMQHVLRYFALLGRLSIVSAMEDDDDYTTDTAKTEGLTLAGLLHTLTTASVKAATTFQQLPTAILLADLVLSTIPYAQGVLSKEYITEYLLDPLETNVLTSGVYKSTFAPGTGISALLLKQAQVDEDDDDEEEEDDDEEEDESGQRCDTLQDLLRSVKRLVQSDNDDDKATQFSLLTDAPWQGLKAAPAASPPPPDGQDVLPEEQLVYKDEPLRLSLSKDCRSIPYLLSDQDDESVQLQCFELDGVIFGRLPIFGSPPEDKDDEEEEEDDQDDMETQTNEQLLAYQKRYGLLDRFFLADAVRDCLLCFQSHVTDAGVERGSAKDVAQQLWTISFLFSQNGVEYGIIEAMLSLIMQANNEGAYRNMYVSRVLLELTRLQPSVMPQALACAVSNVVSYYLPALVPAARDNFSRWLSFHLINTDYQWPAVYWEHWTEYVTNGKRNSRGDFVLRTLSIMTSEVSEAVKIASDCLPSGSSLARYLVENGGGAPVEDPAIASIQHDLEERIWEKNEDPDSMIEYMTSNEVSEKVSALTTEGGMVVMQLCTTTLVTRALLQPATRNLARQKRDVQRLWQASEGEAMEDVDSSSGDVLTMLTENFSRYRPLLLATLAHDAKGQGGTVNGQDEVMTAEGEQPFAGEFIILQELESGLCQSRVLLEACVSCLLENQIVCSEAVMRWVLRDSYDGNTAPDLVTRWWEFAALAIQVEIANGTDLAQSADNPEWSGMVVDRGNEKEGAQATNESADEQRMNAIIQHIDPIMQYTTTRVCQLLRQIGNGTKKLTPLTVDVSEGYKLMLLYAKSSILSELKERNSDPPYVTDKQARDLWSKSSLCGLQLASVFIDNAESSAEMQASVAWLQWV